MQGLKDSFKRGVSWNAVSVFGNILTHFLGSLVFLFFMGPKDFFLVGTLLILMNQAFVVSEFGLATAVVQAKELRPVQMNTVFLINLLVGIALTVLFCALSPVAAWYFKSPVLVPLMAVTSLIFLILSTGLAHKAWLARNVDFRSLSLAEVGGYVTYIVLLIALGWQKAGVWAFAWAKVGQQAVETGMMWRASRFSPNLRNVSFRETRGMLNFGVNMLGAQFVAFLIGNLDGFLVGRYIDKVSGGHYLYARQVVIVPAVRFLKLLTRVSTPILSRIQDDLARMARSFCLMNKFLALLALPAFVGLSCVAPELVRALFPQKWQPDLMIPLLQVLSLSILAHLFAALTIVVYYSLAQANLLMRFQLLVLAVRVVLLSAVVYWTRSVFAVCVAILCERLFFSIFFEKLAFGLMHERATQLFLYLRNPLIGAGLMAAAVTAVSRVGRRFGEGRGWSWGILAVEIAVGALVYGGFILWRDKQVVGEIKAVFAGRGKGKAGAAVGEAAGEME